VPAFRVGNNLKPGLMVRFIFFRLAEGHTQPTSVHCPSSKSEIAGGKSVIGNVHEIRPGHALQ
jgi:hypothetical protein